MPRDWTFAVMVGGAAILLALDLFLLFRIGQRLYIAFGERLDRIPGAALWTRVKRGARFWSAAFVHIAIAAFLVIFALVAGKFLLRVFFASI